jgi:UDP-glucose:glycoprotein glucosyltransferase
MLQPNILASRNSMIFGSKEYVDVSIDDTASVPWIYASDSTRKETFSIFIISDFSLLSGVEFAVAALESMNNDSRIILLHNPEREAPSFALIDDFVNKNNHYHAGELLLKAKELSKMDVFTFDSENIDPVNRLRQKRLLTQFNIESGICAVVINGRMIGPLPSDRLFTSQDFELMYHYEKNNAAYLKEVITKHIEERKDTELETHYSDLMLVTNSLVGLSITSKKAMSFEGTTERTDINHFDIYTNSSNSIILGNRNISLIHLSATIDPVSPAGQKLLAVLDQIRHVHSVSIHILVTPSMSMSEDMPLNRFYRFLFPVELSFSPEGAIKRNTLVFGHLPAGPTLTLGMDVPEPWLVRPFRSPHDLDNIKLSDSGTEIKAEFILSHILVQGHAMNLEKQPPAGLQFVLGTPAVPSLVDTITMANIGYFQLKAHVGIWQLNIRPGRSTQVYEFVSVDNGILDKGAVLVLVSSFGGFIFYYCRCHCLPKS